ncbi:M20 family metallo-hydrolase [Pragia fontium]|uniref:Allantoate deiminase n=2 Tax=Pragia fontium TaxID=82985 RepID=A0AAJ4WAS8_9GAMM|nr:M20 family metallo-hydrolase [Pragia fontium]GKX62336.1 Zn-dependent hydrolase [Pragia fontium]SFC87795.1 allantoate deiminase [Pragia fontium DSM 5563 = ATCC 49100]VEJ56059.1 allantoate amidohydrolase [Pragia fontium]
MIKTERLQADIEALRAISDPCNGGVTRIGFTERYRQGVEYVKQRMQECGLTTYEDEIGNLYGVMEGQDSSAAKIISGSHLDTVRNAGAFDGIAGVVCALEAARVIKERGIKLKHTYEVLGFIEEEGTNFGQVLLGSRFISGDLTDADKDRFISKDKQPLREVLSNYMQGIETVPACRKNDNILAFLEVHDEQGPVLQETNTDIGIVQSIVALSQLSISITGFAGHAGTVPMNLRQDAGLAGCSLVSRMTSYVLRKYTNEATFTVGKFSLLPNSSNCIPNNCSFTIDLRSGTQAIVDNVLDYLQDMKKLVEQEYNVTIDVNIDSYKDEVVMDQGLQQLIAESCDKLGLSYRNINSGAGHDAMIMANLCKTAMIFIPCDRGITHHPLEKVEWEDMRKGTELLLETILRLDSQF